MAMGWYMGVGPPKGVYHRRPPWSNSGQRSWGAWSTPGGQVLEWCLSAQGLGWVQACHQVTLGDGDHVVVSPVTWVTHDQGMSHQKCEMAILPQEALAAPKAVSAQGSGEPVE